jgi:AGZA family xanthine/uracil permease-like MFS transporter
VYCFIGAVLGFIGLIHAEQVGWDVGGQIALGYAFAGIILLGFAFATRGEDPAKTDEPATATIDEAPQPPAVDAPAAVAPVDTTRPATA